MNKVEVAVRFAEKIANDDSHGYDQAKRWGNPDFDCSSLVITAFEQAQILLKTYGATYTGNMGSACVRAGMKNVINSVNLTTRKGLGRGAILLARGKHGVIYCGDGKVVGARINEKGHVVGGKAGDQTGKEICVHKYYNYPWTQVYRYVEASQLATDNNALLEVAKKVINGDYGNGLYRKMALEKAGYDYLQVQNLVNLILKAR